MNVSIDPEPVIRASGTQDVSQIVAMDRLARIALEGQRGGKEWLTEHQALADQDPPRLVSRTLVAEYAGAIVGFLVYDIVERPGRGRLCTIDRVYVEELARELGCGDGLIGLVTEIAVSARCASIEGNALPGDRETKNLYERASMKARKIVTGRDL